MADEVNRVEKPFQPLANVIAHHLCAYAHNPCAHAFLADFMRRRQ